MDHKQLVLHELLQQDQEPFHLDTYISDKRSHLNSSSLHLIRRTSAVPETCTNLCSLFSSPDVGKPPSPHILSPAVSPCSSPCAGAFLHVPSRTAALLVEAAMRIQKQRQSSKPKAQIMNVGLSLFGSFLKILKHRSKNKVLTNYDLPEKENSEEIRISCSCNRLCIDEDVQARSCSSLIMSPFRFSLHKSPSSSARRSPKFLSPATSPIRRIKQEKEKCGSGDEVVHNVKGVEEQCSPVSVLDSLFEEESDDDDLERSYANIERGRRKLLDRLRRFEKLASRDPVQLELELEQADVCKEVKGVAERARFSRMVEMMVKSDGFDEWETSVEETIADMEVAILGGLLMDELSNHYLF